MVVIPKRLNPVLCEEIGAHIGDGSMGIYKGRYIISFCGNPKRDMDYVKWVAHIYEKFYSIKPTIRFWSGVVGFQIFSKEIVMFKKSLGLPLGKKGEIDIPKKILEMSLECIASCIRGVFDTDGTVYLEHKNSKLYPRIQLKITSSKLAKSIHSVLNRRFKIKSTLHWRKERENWRTSYIVECRGKDNLEKWMRTISFRNLRNLNKVYKYYNTSRLKGS
jgi:intein/homing endonuclease